MIIRPEIRSLLLVAVVLGALAGCASTATHAVKGDGEVAHDVGTRAALIAYQQLGTPYRYGGSSPRGFDCSGLVHFSYSAAGRPVPRTTRALWQVATPVARDEIRAGDVLFFNVDGKMSHVGLYVGNSRFVHAPSSGKSVSMASLDSPYYRRSLVRAGRLR